MFRVTLLLYGFISVVGVSPLSSNQLGVGTIPQGANLLRNENFSGISEGKSAASSGRGSLVAELASGQGEVGPVEPQRSPIPSLTTHLQGRSTVLANQLAEGGGEVRGHVYLPPAVAGTPLSFQIHAQAAYMAAYGDAMESMAVARKVNAEAVAFEIQNSIAAVDAYFQRRELNKSYRKYELDSEAIERRHQDRLRRNVEERYQRVLEGDVTRTLNWLLQELTGPTVAYQYLGSSQALVASQLDQKLSPDELRLIRMTDGGGKVQTLAFAANDGQLLKARWPLALEAPQFEEQRKRFEKARDALIREAANHTELGYETSQELRESVIALMVALEAAYPREVRADFGQFSLYSTSKRYLQSLWGGVQRATTTKDLSVFSARLRFEGDSLVALLQHMYQSGLEFAPPEPGGEGVYRKLFQGMRNLYVNVASEKPETDAAKP